ncbi:hypothetical protein FQN57_004613 [Myotisia sp. PD_48]|nr:hypothetical protein FQN57_004613 [Myotisia sp. PD_48]
MPAFNSNGYHADEQPVTPIDIIQPRPSSRVVGFSTHSDNHSTSSQQGDHQQPSTNPPVRSPFSDSPAMSTESESSHPPKVSDVGFGYVADNQPSRNVSFPDAPQNATMRPLNSPLKSALKSPGTPGRFGVGGNPMSPTFREEQILEFHEKETERENAKDVKIKTRVRLSKILLRGVSFSCSLIILALVGASFAVFHATRNLPSRNNLMPWAPNTNPWPQILILVVASISVFLSIAVFYGYCRGGHRRAEKVGVYYTVFAVFMFAFTVILWVVAAATLQNDKNTGQSKDLWGWACKENPRRELFDELVNYGLVCRMQDWVLICIIIEIIVDIITIVIYAVIFYRFYSKRKLRKSMNVRDKARSDLYLSHLRSQSAPNTPGYPLSPGSTYYPPTKHESSYVDSDDGTHTQYAQVKTPSVAVTASHRPFQLQPPPLRSNDGTGRSGSMSSVANSPSSPRMSHFAAGPGEQAYGAVPIPTAYASPLSSPTFIPQNNPQSQANEEVGVAVSSNQRTHAHNG